MTREMQGEATRNAPTDDQQAIPMESGLGGEFQPQFRRLITCLTRKRSDMVVSGERKPLAVHSAEFAELASLFSERLLVVIQVYADESSVSGVDAKIPVVPSICGLADTPENWIRFSKVWKNTLDDFGAEYFHFREFADKDNGASPYFNWSGKKRDRFLYQLAFVTSISALSVGGFENFAGRAAPRTLEKYENALRLFFNDLVFAIEKRWPGFKGKILFIFDRNDNSDWDTIVFRIYSEFCQKDSRFGGLTFEDDKDPKHTPLQAADLAVYLYRQLFENWIKSGKEEPPELRALDLIMRRSRDEKLRNLDGQHWASFVEVMNVDRLQKAAEWRKQGIKRVYYPAIDFPFDLWKSRIREHRLRDSEDLLKKLFAPQSPK